MPYTDLGLTTNAADLFQAGVQRIRDELDDQTWQPSPAEELILLAGARMGVTITVLAGQVPDDAIVPTIGAKIFRIPVLDATPATATVTLHMTAAPADSLAAGASFDIDGVGFHSADPVSWAAAATTASVSLIADLPGADANGLLGAAVTLTSPSLVYVDTVTLDAPTADGTDGETPAEYLDRLVEETPTMSPKALYVSDFEAIARRNPLVGRALAIRFYDPGPPIDAASPGHVSVFLQGLTGLATDSTVKGEVAADLGPDDIVLGPTVHILDGTYTLIDVTFTALCYDTYDATVEEAAAEAALTARLDPTVWGKDPDGPATSWIVEALVRRNDLIGAIYRDVQGIRHVQTLTLRRRVPVTGVASTDVLTSTAHGFVDTDQVQLVGITGGAPLLADGTIYFVRDATTDTFKLAATSGGAAINLTTDLTAGTIGPPLGTTDVTLPGPAPLTLPGVIDGTVTLT